MCPLIDTILKDKLPRSLSYPVSSARLSDEIAEVADLSRIALYFAYESCGQCRHHDPSRDEKSRYPILALRNGLPELYVDQLAGDLADDPEARSILVFPIKSRAKSIIAEALSGSALRPVRNWFGVSPERQKDQQTLVLIFDETSKRIIPKFADDYEGLEKHRFYS